MRALRLGAATAAIGICLCAGAALADEPPPAPRLSAGLHARIRTGDQLRLDRHLFRRPGRRRQLAHRVDLRPADGAPTIEHSHTGFTGGAHAGLQKQWSWLVVGAEVSYLWMDQPESTGSPLFAGAALRATSIICCWSQASSAGPGKHPRLRSGVAGPSGNVDFRTPLTGGGTLLFHVRPARTAGPQAPASNTRCGTTSSSASNTTTWSSTPGGRIQSRWRAGVNHVDAGVDIQSITARLSFKFGGGAHP